MTATSVWMQIGLASKIKGKMEMNCIVDRLVTIAAATNRPTEEVLTYHLLEGVLRRVSGSIHNREWVLRGGMLTRLWVAPEQRVAVDVDFLSLDSFDVEGTLQKFRATLAATGFTDGVAFDLDSLQAQAIWAETEFPGVRINVDADIGEFHQNIQIDVGFGDPLVPPAQWIDYPTLLGSEALRVQAVRPETMVGWKLHGLVEHGMKRWRPKDLYDLMLFSNALLLNESELPQAVAIAFSSRNTPLQEVLDLLSVPAWWNNSKNRSKWAWYTRRAPTQTMPTDLSFVVAAVIGRWKGVVEALVDSKPNY